MQSIKHLTSQIKSEYLQLKTWFIFDPDPEVKIELQKRSKSEKNLSDITGEKLYFNCETLTKFNSEIDFSEECFEPEIEFLI